MKNEKSKHTPGPWRAIKRGADCDFIFNIATKDNPRSIANVIDAGTTEQINQYEKENGEQAANARLIAAAPELLAALESCSDALNTEAGGLYKARIDQARAAIAKAKGE